MTLTHEEKEKVYREFVNQNCMIGPYIVMMYEYKFESEEFLKDMIAKVNHIEIVHEYLLRTGFWNVFYNAFQNLN